MDTKTSQIIKQKTSNIMDNINIPKNIVGIIMINLVYAIGVFIKNLDKNKPISKIFIKTGLIATITTAISTIGTAIEIYQTNETNKLLQGLTFVNNADLTCEDLKEKKQENIDVIKKIYTQVTGQTFDDTNKLLPFNDSNIATLDQLTQKKVLTHLNNIKNIDDIIDEECQLLFEAYGGYDSTAEIINIITIALLDNYFIDDLTDVIYNELVSNGYLVEEASKIISNNPTLKRNAITRPMDYIIGINQTNIIETAIHDLARLKHKITMSDALNHNGTFSSVGAGLTWNMKFLFRPVSRSGMYGGGTTLWDIEPIVKSKDTESGLISQMYTNIVEFLDTNQIQLSKKSKSQIEDKLTKFKTAELELNNALEEAVNRVKILKNTNGRIDIDKASNEEERQKLVEIYSDIPRLIGNTNKLSATMMGIFQSMLQAAADANEKKSLHY